MTGPCKRKWSSQRSRRGSNNGIFARNRIDTCQVRAFAKVAAVTRKGQIAVVIGPAVLAGHDMPDVMRQGTTVLRKKTIFTAVADSGSDEYPGRRLHRYVVSES
jgi:hypothetical protein